jgi:hypothetical protein
MFNYDHKKRKKKQRAERVASEMERGVFTAYNIEYEYPKKGERRMSREYRVQ